VNNSIDSSRHVWPKVVASLPFAHSVLGLKGGACTPPFLLAGEGALSHQATTWVLERSEAEGRNLVVLFVIANHCNPDGTGAFPSINRIAGQSRICEKTARVAIQELEASGELLVSRTKGQLPNQEWQSRNSYAIPGVIRDGFYRERSPKPAVTGTAGSEKPAVNLGIPSGKPSGNDLPPIYPKEQILEQQPNDAEIASVRPMFPKPEKRKPKTKTWARPERQVAAPAPRAESWDEIRKREDEEYGRLIDRVAAKYAKGVGGAVRQKT
jgi:hypothetical protein